MEIITKATAKLGLDQNLTPQGLDDILDPSEKQEKKEPSEKYIYLIATQTSEKIKIRYSAVKLSILIKTMCEGDIEATEFDIHNVAYHMLTKIVEYLEYHNGIPPAKIEKPLKSGDLKKAIPDKWDYEFINKFTKWSELCELLNAANYMDIKPLLKLAAAKYASHCHDKSEEQLREMMKVDKIPKRV